MFLAPVIRIKFEDNNDLVNYISKGLIPPSRRQFNDFISKVKSPDNPLDEEALLGKEVFISTDLFNDDMSNTEMANILECVYNNRIENVKTGAKTIAIVLGCLLLISILSSNNKK